MSKTLLQSPLAGSRKPWIQVSSETGSKQLREVFRTYTTRWEWWMLLAAWLVLMLANVVATPFLRTVLVVVVFPYANVTLGLLLGMQLKLQFGDCRARLLPDFAAAHLAVPAAIVAAAAVLESVPIALGCSVSGWAVSGLALVLMAAGAWCAYLFSLRSFLLIAGLPALAMAIARQHVVGPMQAAILGDNPAMTLAMIGLGVVTLTVLGARLRRLSEEMPEYSRRIPATLWDSTSRAARRDRLQWESRVIARSRLQGWISDLQFRLVLPWTATRSAVARLLLRQLAGGCSWVFLAPVQMLFVLCSLAPYLLRKPGRIDDVAVSLLPALIMPIVFAIGLMTAAWLERRPYAARELLHPLSRTDFVRDLIRSSACDTLGLALWHGVGIVVGLSVFLVPELRMRILWPCLAIMAMQYVVLFGVMLWLVSFLRYNWMAMVGIVLVSIPSGALAMAALMAGDLRWTLAVAPVLTVVAAVGFYRAAFRRWCEADLD